MASLHTGTRRTRAVALAAPLAALLFAVAACSGEDSSASADVASLSEDVDDDATETTVGGDIEEQYNDWAACMSEQGVDVPDASVNENGEFQLDLGQGGGRPPAGGAGGGFDSDARDAAIEVCGEIPEGLVGGFDQANNQEFQDSLLEFAQCMRDNGVDMEDPDFSGGFGGGPGGGGGEGGQGPFGAFDEDDPATQAALEECQSLLAQVFPGGAPGADAGEDG